MNWNIGRLLIVPAILFCATLVHAEPKDAPATHDVVATISVKGKSGNITLQTLCVNSKGDVVALVAPPRSYGAPQKNAVSEVHVLSCDGKEQRVWTVDFHANSINVGPDGSVYVAGDGKVSKYGADGKLLAHKSLPHIAELLKDAKGMRKKAEEQLKQQKESFAQSIKTYEGMKKKLEEKMAEDRTKLEQRQLEQYTQILKSFEETKKYYDNQSVDVIVEQMTSRLRVINGIAASEKDVFIVCGESQGYGFALWRMDHQFENAKQVKSNVVGCCGQMDVQCCGNDIVLAENTKHRFAKYDRDGKELGAWGKRAAAGDSVNFGGCCNPMNLRCCATGDFLTAESEGIIKRFSAKGEFLGTVASTKLTGGCKNVAVASSPDGEKVYLCDLPGSKLVIMGLKSAKKTD
jgi:hypothetical protein